jgi:hypothetical protein
MDEQANLAPDAKQPGYVAEIDLTPYGASWGSQPRHHGEIDYVFPGRAVLVLPGREWLAEPEACEWDGPGEWVLDDKVLVCPCCGLDCT